MLSRDRRLSSAQFDRAYAHSLSVRHPLVALKAHRRDDDFDSVRAAFVVPKSRAKPCSAIARGGDCASVIVCTRAATI